MKGFFDHKRPALWITASLAAASVVPAVLLLRKPGAKRRPRPEEIWSVEEVVYQAPFYSVRLKAETAPCYRLTEDFRLLMKEASPQDSVWVDLGEMGDIQLKKINFDDYFFTGKKSLFFRLRKKNQRAWLLDCGQGEDAVFYYLLQQGRGELYLALGYRADENEGTEDRASIIRGLFKLRPLG